MRLWPAILSFLFYFVFVFPVCYYLLFLWVSSVAPCVASFCLMLGGVVISPVASRLFSFRFLSLAFLFPSVFTRGHRAHLVSVPVLCPRAILTVVQALWSQATRQMYALQVQQKSGQAMPNILDTECGTYQITVAHLYITFTRKASFDPASKFLFAFH